MNKTSGVGSDCIGSDNTINIGDGSYTFASPNTNTSSGSFRVKMTPKKNKERTSWSGIIVVDDFDTSYSGKAGFKINRIVAADREFCKVHNYSLFSFKNSGGV